MILALMLAACATSNRPPSRVPTARAPASVPGAPKIGKPYQVFGVWYYPADDRAYDEKGIASWYGPGFHALSTANGERYDQDDVTAAHKTLPMPSYVEVENLDNGRRLTVRVNDRGPFVAGRIIDLSRRSAQLLGVDRVGTARVRVRRVYPDADTRQRLAPPPAPPPLPPIVVASAAAVAPIPDAVPVVSTVTIPGSAPPAAVSLANGHFIQVAALTDAGRIAWLSGYLTAFGPVLQQPAPNGLTRIRLGPFKDDTAANAVLAQLRVAGYSEARLILPSSGIATTPRPVTP
ncbi:septal ring lytic transglycosylase RlpA family protein [Sandarakinorhabdus sp. DWP1-3-1]|uniref:septal ring lytic transglycosylase RlpA family protein n=1 Tax=Sandarakinorhabdus sp. DWP1-3-1 TaxID=2804627 RepID=UPI003CEB6B9D